MTLASACRTRWSRVACFKRHKNNCLTARTTRVSQHQHSEKDWPSIPPSLSSDTWQAFLAFHPRPPVIPLGINRYNMVIWYNMLTGITWFMTLGRTGETQLKKHEELEDKNLHFLYTRLILDLMRTLINRWSLLPHSLRVSHAMCPMIFLRQMPFLQQSSLFLSLRTG